MATDEKRAAMRVRDHVIPLVQAKGRSRPVGPTSEMMWEAGQFRFALRTALSPALLHADAPEYSHAQADEQASRMLPSGLDIWHQDKVLSLQWDADELIVTHFQRGVWEDEVLALR